MKQIRQGDVFLVEVNQIPKTAKKQKKKGDIILAYGEVTGHAHRIKSGAEMWLAENGERYLKIVEATALIHEEHSAPTQSDGLDEGMMFKVVQQMHYTPQEIQRVAD